MWHFGGGRVTGLECLSEVIRVLIRHRHRCSDRANIGRHRHEQKRSAGIRGATRTIAVAAAAFVRPAFAGVAYRYNVQVRARNVARWRTEAAEVSNEINEAATPRSGRARLQRAAPAWLLPGTAAASDKYSNE